MRVFLSTDLVGGVWDYTLALVRELRAAGHEVMLALIGRPSEATLAAIPQGVVVEWAELRLEWMPDAAGDLAAGGAWLSAAARRWGAEVVHLNQMAYAVHDFGAPTLVVVHSDVLSWLGETLGADAGPEWGEYAGWVREGIAAADVLVTPSRYQSDLCRRHYGRAADRVIHNGARPPAPPPTRREPLLVTAGRAWDEAKGMRVVDEALGLLGGFPPGHLFGEETGPHGQRFHARHLQRHGRTDRAELDAWMRRAALYAGASLYEPFGLAPLEAALHGCALVLSDIGSFRELWDGCAEFFPRGDARALADAVARLSANPDHRESLTRAAGARALERYGAVRFAAEYLLLYTEMAENGSTRFKVQSARQHGALL